VGTSPRGGEERREARGSGSPPSSRGRAHCRAAAALGIQAAQALEHAHQNGVLHRDVKPSNLLVDARGKLWVADFGLARIQGDSQLTQTGDLIGTLRYMSPEQAHGKRGVIDGRADVYSLGATLYELLTLRPAFAGHDRGELLARIAEQEPVAPRRINPIIPRDLETIVLKAMAKEPAARYATAQDLADDLGRYLAGDPIKARPASTAMRLRARVKRHRTVSAAGSLALVATAVIVGIAAWSNGRQRGLADQIATRKSRENEELQASADVERKTVALKRAVRELDRRGFVFQLQQTFKRHRSGQPDSARETLRAIEADCTGYDPREFAWRYARNLFEPGLRPVDSTSRSGDSPVGQTEQWCIPSPDGETLATVIPTYDPVRKVGPILRFLDRTTRDVRNTVQLSFAPRNLDCIVDTYGSPFSPDGRYFLVHGPTNPTEGETQHRIQIWEVSTGQLVCDLPRPPTLVIKRVELLQGGRFVLGEADPPPGGNQFRWAKSVWELQPNDKVPRLVTSVPRGGRFFNSPDGRMVPIHVTTGPEKPSHELGFLDASTGLVAGSRGTDGPYFDRQNCPIEYGVVVSPDWKSLAGHHGFFSDTTKKLVGFWDLETGRVAKHFELSGHFLPWWITDSPDAKTIAVPYADGQVKLYDRDRGPTHSLPAFSRTVSYYVLKFSRDGSVLAICPNPHLWNQAPVPANRSNQTITIWDVATGQKVATSAPIFQCYRMMFSPDGRDLVLSCQPSAFVWRLDAYKPVILRSGLADPRAIAVSPHGGCVATAGNEDEAKLVIQIWNSSSARVIRRWHCEGGPVAKLAFSPDGKWLASAHINDEQNVRLWDAGNSELVKALSGSTEGARAVVFSPDGKRLAWGGADGTIRVYDIDRRTSTAFAERHLTPIESLAFSRDGKQLASSGADGVRLWDIATGTVHAALAGGRSRSVSFSANSDSLDVVDTGAIISWHLDAAESLQSDRKTLKAEPGELEALAFAPDGATIAAAGKSGKVRLFDTLTGQELFVLDGNAEPVRGLAFSPDGSSIVSCCGDGSIKIWNSGWWEDDLKWEDSDEHFLTTKATDR
jgi:WD40 repeat protein